MHMGRERGHREPREPDPRRRARHVRAREPERPRERGPIDQRCDPDGHAPRAFGAHEDGVRQLDALAESFAAKAAQYMDIVKPAGPTSRTRCRSRSGRRSRLGDAHQERVGAPARRPRRALRARHRRDRRWDRLNATPGVRERVCQLLALWSTSRSCRERPLRVDAIDGRVHPDLERHANRRRRDLADLQ